MFDNGIKLPVYEEFYSIQGEGEHSGKPAYFIRLGGCDLACHWCDAKRTWRAGVHQLLSVEDIVNKALKTPAKAVVVTGGEPTSYNLELLCSLLKKHNIETFIETSGAYRITGEWNWICLSPKKQKPPVKENYKEADELKIIIFSENDFKWAEQCASRVGEGCKLYLQAEWSKYKTMIHPIVEYVKNNPKWNISIQAHKFMNIP